MSRIDPSAVISLTQIGAALEDRTTDGAVSPAVLVPTDLVHISLALPDAAATYSYVLPVAYEFVDVVCRKQAAGTTTTYTLKDGAGNAISDVISAVTDKAITRMATNDVAFNPKAGITTFQVSVAKAGGSAACDMTLIMRRR